MGKHLEQMVVARLLKEVKRYSFHFRRSSNQQRIRYLKLLLLGNILRFRLNQDRLGILEYLLLFGDLRSVEHIHLIRQIPIHLHIT